MAYIITKEEAMPYLPKKQYDIFEVEMTEPQRIAYENLRVNLIHECQNTIDSTNGQNRALIVNNILVKLLRLAQVTSGFLKLAQKVDDMGNIVLPEEVQYFDPNPKLDGLCELIKQDPDRNHKTIIWALWHADINAITKRFKELGNDHALFYGLTKDPEREKSERRFNYDPNCRYLIGSAASGGVGLNLLGHPPDGNDKDCTTDCTHVIFYSQGWSHPHRSQSEDRPHRRGTRVPVRYTDLQIPGTIDAEIRARVTMKRAQALEVSDVRQILNAMLHGVSRDDD
jgi:SNF2 family DNA or RNA helicase